jgi:hypothetical protein
LRVGLEKERTKGGLGFYQSGYVRRELVRRDPSWQGMPPDLFCKGAIEEQMVSKFFMDLTERASDSSFSSSEQSSCFDFINCLLNYY